MATTTIATDPVILDVTPNTVVAAIPTVRSETDGHRLATRILMFSFAAAVLLAIAGFVVVAVYLFMYLTHGFAAFDREAMTQLSGMDLEKMRPILLARTSLWKFILQSCGIVAGAAFGFLGFALFLIGAKGDMDATFQDSEHKVQLERMAPGSFVILISAILIGLCSIHKVTLEFDTTTTQSHAVPAQSQTNTGSVQAGPSVTVDRYGAGMVNPFDTSSSPDLMPARPSGAAATLANKSTDAPAGAPRSRSGAQ